MATIIAPDIFLLSQLKLLEEVSKPVWIYRYATFHDCNELPTITSGQTLSEVMVAPQATTWWCSCSSRRNIWANKTALQLFRTNIQEFIALDYASPAAGTVSKDDFATFNALNSLVHEEVEVFSLPFFKHMLHTYRHWWMLCKFPVPADFCQAAYNAGSEQLLNTAKYFASSHYAVVWLVRLINCLCICHGTFDDSWSCT